MRLMGLDVSDTRIGIAMTDPLGWTVQPVETVERYRIEQDLEILVQYVQDHSVAMVVVGLPLQGETGRVGAQARKILVFCEQLRAYCRGRGVVVDIVTWDESMTTKEAEAFLQATGVRRKHRRTALDQMAAVFLLQSYLAAQREVL